MFLHFSSPKAIVKCRNWKWDWTLLTTNPKMCWNCYSKKKNVSFLLNNFVVFTFSGPKQLIWKSWNWDCYMMLTLLITNPKVCLNIEGKWNCSSKKKWLMSKNLDKFMLTSMPWKQLLNRYIYWLLNRKIFKLRSFELLGASDRTMRRKYIFLWNLLPLPLFCFS